jgi:hypothetical protein
MPEQVRYRTKLTQSVIFFSPDPGWNSGCRNANASVSFIDADAQLGCITIQGVPGLYYNWVYLAREYKDRENQGRKYQDGKHKCSVYQVSEYQGKEY